MAAVAERLGTNLLKKFACGLAKEAGSKLMEKGLEEIFGSEMEDLKNEIHGEIEQVKKEIQEAIKEIREVKEAVDNLTNKLSQSILQLRTDTLKGHLTTVNSVWNEIMDILETAVIDADISDAKTRKRRMRELQTRLDYMLTRASNEVPKSLENIHDFLGEVGENSFLKQLAQQAFDSSRDFRLFFFKARSLVESYWSVVCRGIQLLQMATEAPRVKFYEGRRTTERHLGYIEQQHELFVSAIGKATIDLFEHMCGEHIGPTEVAFATNTGTGIEKDPNLPLDCPHARFTAQPSKWILTQLPGREGAQGQVEFNWFSDWAYYFHIPLTDDYLTRHLVVTKLIEINIPWPIIGAKNGSSSLDAWYIKPHAPGSDRFTIFQVDKDEFYYHLVINEGLRIVRTPKGQNSPCQDKLFQLRPWLENV
ncbi:hypothetical protein NW768_010047 [Fusarium equiseti]|uniref:Vegetative incompatibility protein het-e-1 n=1 Tax=Fusarium equiseti TaxID=61235 RepID=A0ABQ8R1S6_FUSEQ|nr:hypothetical protein NW768_010047 [Fusarium equiseti]